MTDQELHDFIAGIPDAKALADAGLDNACADMLNNVGTDVVAVPTVGRDKFLLGLTPAYLVLPTTSTLIQNKWDRILAVLRASDTIIVNPLLLDSAVADGILTQPEADATWHRAGSPAEVAFGAGTVISHGDVSRVWLTYRPGGIVGGTE